MYNRFLATNTFIIVYKLHLLDHILIIANWRLKRLGDQHCYCKEVILSSIISYMSWFNESRECKSRVNKNL